jgi:hypothetical protein
MRRLGWAALCAAAVIGAAGSAGAAIMQASFFGDYDDLEPAFVGWQATLTYDTTRGSLTVTPTSEVLSWNTAMGGSSPLIDFSGEVFGTQGGTFDFTSATSFVLTRDANHYLFELTGSAFRASLGYGFILAPPDPLDPGNTDFSLDTPYSHGGFGNADLVVLPPGHNQIPFMIGMSVAKIAESPAVPEPSTWAMMLVGFFGLGAALRKQWIAPATA